MWQCSLHWCCVQQSRDRHSWGRREDRRLQSWSGGSESSRRLDHPPVISGNAHRASCHVTYMLLLDGWSLPENADSSTIHAVTYLRTTEILTVNSIGQLKMWDFRQQSTSPSQILSLYELFIFNHVLSFILSQCCTSVIIITVIIFFSLGRGIESLSTVLIDIRTNNTLLPLEGRTACSVSGTWDKGVHPSHSLKLTLLRVRHNLRCTINVYILINSPFIQAFLFWFLFSVGSSLSPIQPRPSVYMFRRWVTVALGDFVTFRYVLFTR